MQNSQFTIMASISRRLFLIRKTLRPGPARAKSATPAAGPGERFARKCVVNNFGRSLRGTPGDSRMFAGLCRPRLRPARLKRAVRCTGNCSKTIVPHPPPHSSERLLLAPAAGVRKRETGVLSSIGTEGDGWSSSSFGGAYPHNAGYLQLVANRVYPQNNAGRSYALTVRCVQHLLRSCFFVHASFRDGFL